MAKKYKIDVTLLAKLVGIASGILFLPIEIKVGFVLRPFDFLFVLCVFIASIFFNKKSLLKSFFSNKLNLIYIILALYVTFNGLVLNPSSFGKEFFQQVEFIIFLYLIYGIFHSPKARAVFLKFFYWTVVLIIAYTVLWHIGNGRIVGYKALNEPKYLFGVVTLLLFVKNFYYSKYTSAFYVSLIFLIFSLERKCWFAFLFGVLGITYFLFRFFGYKFKVMRMYSVLTVVGLSLGTLVVGGAFAGSEILVDQFGDTVTAFSKFSLEDRETEEVGSQSNAARMYLFAFSFQNIKENPIFGIGTDKFKEENEKVAFKLGEKKAHGSHNEYMRIAVENGLPALFMYVLLWIIAFQRAKKINIRRRKSTKAQQVELLTILGLLFYGAIINIFLGGGATNKFFLALPLGMITGYQYGDYLIYRQINEKTK
ncbi:MAG: O-antigen ligase family protein [Saprospiraceae bacterium]